MFEELKNTYPKSIKGPNGAKRVLHTDMARCRKLYKDTVKIDVSLHNLILKCIKLYIKDKKEGNSVEFIQALPAFLHQRNWEGYIDALMALRNTMSHLHELENDLDHVENLLFNLKNQKVSSK